MMKFSDRLGITKVKKNIQLNFMDSELRIGLWNVFKLHYVDKMAVLNDLVILSQYRDFINEMWRFFFKKPLDELPRQVSNIVSRIKNEFLKSEWFEVYNFLEFCLSTDSITNIDLFIEDLNFVLKMELSGYRVVANEFTPITNDQQLDEIQKAIDVSLEKILLSGVNIHLKSALQKLSDKSNPDYRNSIKESISAIESLVQVITGDKKAELGKGLKLIKEKIGLHTALEQGYLKIYGYSSDDDGIRHSLTEESKVDIEDAIYMLVSCSAFINYLITKAGKANIL